MYYDIVSSTFIPMLIAADGSGIHCINFVPESGSSSVPPGWKRSPEFLKKSIQQIVSYLNGDLNRFTLEVNPSGTDFQKRVWNALQNIPYGKTVSYQDIAIAVGKPSATRAVGMACGKNPIPIIIPCHRVIGKNGKLTGYSGGLDIKIRLLQLEGVS